METMVGRSVMAAEMRVVAAKAVGTQVGACVAAAEAGGMGLVAKVVMVAKEVAQPAAVAAAGNKLHTRNCDAQRDPCEGAPQREWRRAEARQHTGLVKRLHTSSRHRITH